MLICQGPRRQSVIVHQPWHIGTGGDISLALSPSPPQHRSETGSRTSSHAPQFLITQYKRCLKPSFLATKCFGAVLYFGFAVSLTPLPATPTHSYRLKYPRNCITELFSNSQMDLHCHSCISSVLLLFAEYILNLCHFFSTAAPVPSFFPLTELTHPSLMDTARHSRSTSIQTGFQPIATQTFANIACLVALCCMSQRNARVQQFAH